MNFSTWSIRNPIPAILLFVLLTFLGLIGFRSMGVQEFPDIELPVVTVTTALPGASPEQLENEVARKVENATANLPSVKHVYSTINNGVVVNFIEFRLEKNVAEAVDDVRDALSRIRSDLPSEVKEQIISKVNTSGRPILIYSATSNHLDEDDLSWWIDNKVAKTLLSVPGVGRFSRVGGVDREIRIEIDPNKLTALGVTAAEISRQLQRVQQESSGGKVDLSGAQQSVRTVGTVDNVARIARMEIALSDGRKLRLDQVATVSDTRAERSSIALLDGKPVVGFEITRAKGASEVAVAESVRGALATLNASDSDVTVKEVFNAVDPVAESYSGSMALLYEGAILAVVVVWLFLRDWRATLVSAAALPLSIIPTFWVMYALGFSLNTVTLQSLALVVGILVDDAIVEIENIVRHLRLGKSPLQAALEAADEIGLAVIATTLTLVAVFFPTVFMSGIAGKFFKQFGWTASIAVLASLLVARLLTPMMAAYLLKPLVHRSEEHPWMRRYLEAASWCIRHRRMSILLAGGFFVASLALIPLLPTGFLPASDRAQSMVRLELPPGSTLAQTRAMAERARTLIRQLPEVTQVYTAIGGGFSGGGVFSSAAIGEARKATLTINLKSRKDRHTTQTEIEASLRDKLASLPGTIVTIGSGDTGEQLILVLSGDDANTLTATVQRVQREIRGIAGLGNITSTANIASPELIVTPDFAKAADLGVTTSAIGDTLRVATAGDYDQALSKLNLPNRQVPIRVRLSEAARQDLDLLARLAVPGKHGMVMLGSVADLRIDSGPAEIKRLDHRRTITITCELNGMALGAALAQINALPSLKVLPPGINREPSGDAEMMQDLFSSFGLAMFTGVLCIYMVLVLLFKDFLQPVTILAALPLSIGGALLGLLLTRNALSMPSLIGLLMLMGIAVKNSILLVEYAVVARHKQGMSRIDALVDACRKRAKPIIMTTIAMGVGMLPLALGMGADPSFRSPMAIAVIGGLITSTLLSLLVIPAVFTYVDDLLQWGKQLRMRCRERDDRHAQKSQVPVQTAPSNEI